MRFESIKIYQEKRFAIEQDLWNEKSYCISFPVFNGLIDYDEYYKISEEEFQQFTQNENELFTFVQECKEHKHDHRLIIPAGEKRGIPC